MCHKRVSRNKSWPPLLEMLPTDYDSFCLPIATERLNKNDVPKLNVCQGITPLKPKLRVWECMLGGSGMGTPRSRAFSPNLRRS